MKLEIKLKRPKEKTSAKWVALGYFIYIVLLGMFGIIPVKFFLLGWFLPLLVYWALNINIRKIK